MPQDIYAERLLILDFGSQYSQLIARRVREIGVYCELHPYDQDEQYLRAFNPKAIILSGGPESVTCTHTPRAPDVIFELGVPLLGICYGMQTMAEQLGGAVSAEHQHELGYAQVQLEDTVPLLANIHDHINVHGQHCLEVWMSHGDQVSQLPAGFVTAASTNTCPVAAMAWVEKHWYGVQFHPEVTHTRQGMRILERFVLDIAGCQALWTPAHVIDDRIHALRQQIGDQRVLLGLSGGVDSSVMATLLHRAIGDQLTCLFVDNGLLRLHEADQVMALFAQDRGINIIRIDAQEQFLSRLKGIHDPEAKRKIIGHTFIDIFNEQAAQLGGIRFLAQGTIYPDVIESAGAQSGTAHVIKSHHNVGGLPETIQFALVEPLRELFKDEVRNIGLALGLPHDRIYRHPFPGPGLGVRILGEVTPTYLDILRQADAIFMEELQQADVYHKVSQAFAVFLPVKSVGVVGDSRRYEYVIALRAVETTDFMTARWARLPHALLETAANRIINEIPRVSRVTYDISSKPPATIEWE